jgi:hypothetical protein
MLFSLQGRFHGKAASFARKACACQVAALEAIAGNVAKLARTGLLWQKRGQA